METLRVDELIIGKSDGEHLHLTAGKIVARDGHGCVRLYFSQGEKGIPDITLYDSNGTERLSIGVRDNGGPYVLLNDGNGTMRLGIEMDSYDGGPRLTLYGQDETVAFTIAGREEGTVELLHGRPQGGLEPWVPTPAPK